jgi:enamine deaminase RidA (YjgF/YER057c/UK114 family)
MTTNHIGLRGHFELFQSVRINYLKKPYPAWTAVVVVGLRREDTVVKVNLIAVTEC